MCVDVKSMILVHVVRVESTLLCHGRVLYHTMVSYPRVVSQRNGWRQEHDHASPEAGSSVQAPQPQIRRSIALEDKNYYHWYPSIL